MEDCEIIQLFEQRDETAIWECKVKYENLCYSIAYHILGTHEDAEECVNDAFLKLWNAIPPERPESLHTYLSTITRNTAFDRRRYINRAKRKNSELDLVLAELTSELATDETPETHLAQQELIHLINRFLKTLSEKDRNIFVCRYYYVQPNREIAQKYHTNAKNVHMILIRSLKKLKQFLYEENYQ